MKIGIAAFLCMAATMAVMSVGSDAKSSEARPPKFKEVPGCQLPPGWDGVVARKPRFVIFGELHGTQQSPAFVGDVACALAAKGERILVAVEHSSQDNVAFQAAWTLPDAQFPQVLKQAGWADRDDGVGSEAMLALLVRLHQLAQRGQSVDVVAFNGVRDEEQARRFSNLPGQGPHEAAQAENIRIAAAAHPYDHVLVLVGNAHARKRPVDHSGAAFEPMAMRLAAPSAMVTLNMQTAGGTAWDCEMKTGITPKPGKPITNSDIACGSRLFRGDADLQRPPFITLGSLPGLGIDPDYDGVYWLGRVSASPPAVRAG